MLNRAILGIISGHVAYGPSNPVSTLLAVGCATGLIVYDTTTWSPVFSSSFSGGAGRRGAFSPDGSLYAHPSASSPFIRVLETTSWSTVALPSGVTNTAEQAAFSLDGNFLAVAYASSPYLRVFRTSDWAQETVPSGPQFPGYGCDFSPSSGVLAAVPGRDPNRTVGFYTPPGWGLTLPTVGASAAGYAVAYSKDGSLLAVGLATANNAVRIYNIVDNTTFTLPEPTNRVSGVSFSSDGQYLAVAQTSAPHVLVYDTSTWMTVSSGSWPSNGMGVGFSIDSKYLAAATNDSPYLTVKDVGTWSSVSVSGLPSGASFGATFN